MSNKAKEVTQFCDKLIKMGIKVEWRKKYRMVYLKNGERFSLPTTPSGNSWRYRAKSRLRRAGYDVDRL